MKLTPEKKHHNENKIVPKWSAMLRPILSYLDPYAAKLVDYGPL